MGDGVPQRASAPRPAPGGRCLPVARLPRTFVARVGVPAARHGSSIAQRACVAARFARDAHREPPSSIVGRVRRRPPSLVTGGRSPPSRRVASRGGPGSDLPSTGAGRRASGVGVDDGMPLAVGEHGDRACGVVADAGEGEAARRPHGDDAAWRSRISTRRGAATGAPRVAEVRRLAHRLGGGGRRQLRRRRPALQPRIEVGDDPVPRRPAAAWTRSTRRACADPARRPGRSRAFLVQKATGGCAEVSRCLELRAMSRGRACAPA